jgi:hypothetical protein
MNKRYSVNLVGAPEIKVARSMYADLGSALGRAQVEARKRRSLGFGTASEYIPAFVYDHETGTVVYSTESN